MYHSCIFLKLKEFWVRQSHLNLCQYNFPTATARTKILVGNISAKSTTSKWRLCRVSSGWRKLPIDDFVNRRFRKWWTNSYELGGQHTKWIMSRSAIFKIPDWSTVNLYASRGLVRHLRNRQLCVSSFDISHLTQSVSLSLSLSLLKHWVSQ